jgi:hypothetical protein
MQNQSQMLTLSGRIYNLLLLAYPARFRRAFGQEMAQVFRDDLRHTLQESGLAGLVGLWFLVVLDLVKTAFAEHIWEVFHMPIEKLERWTGLAAALGGALFTFIAYGTSISLLTDVVVLVLFLAMFILWAIALAGLYLRLPAASHPGNMVTSAIAELGLLLLAIGFLLLFLTDSSDIVYNMLGIGGISGFVLGIAGMGIIALRYRAMGVWRFVPLLLAGVSLGFVVSFIQDLPVSITFIYLTSFCWLLLGIGLWTSAKEEGGPALPA